MRLVYFLVFCFLVFIDCVHISLASNPPLQSRRPSPIVIPTEAVHMDNVRPFNSPPPTPPPPPNPNSTTARSTPAHTVVVVPIPQEPDEQITTPWKPLCCCLTFALGIMAVVIYMYHKPQGH